MILETSEGMLGYDETEESIEYDNKNHIQSDEIYLDEKKTIRAVVMVLSNRHLTEKGFAINISGSHINFDFAIWGNERIKKLMKVMEGAIV